MKKRFIQVISEICHDEAAGIKLNYMSLNISEKNVLKDFKKHKTFHQNRK
jgi:hypothetical protein